MAAPAVRFQAVDFRWSSDSPLLLSDFDLVVEAASVTAIVGPSGCGKSTLLRLAAGLVHPTSGTVNAGPAGAGHRGYVFQAPTLLPWRSVAENVGLPLDLVPGFVPRERTRRIADALRAVQLEDAADKLPHALSGGMQMRASLARALVTRPKLLLLDEPFSALDALTRRLVHQQFQAAWRAAAATVLFVTHDIDEAVLLADRVVSIGGSPLQIRADLPIPLPHPRTPELRHDPALGALVRTLEESL